MGRKVVGRVHPRVWPMVKGMCVQPMRGKGRRRDRKEIYDCSGVDQAGCRGIPTMPTMPMHARQR